MRRGEKVVAAQPGGGGEKSLRYHHKVNETKGLI